VQSDSITDRGQGNGIIDCQIALQNIFINVIITYPRLQERCYSQTCIEGIALPVSRQVQQASYLVGGGREFTDYEDDDDDDHYKRDIRLVVTTTAGCQSSRRSSTLLVASHSAS